LSSFSAFHEEPYCNGRMVSFPAPGKGIPPRLLFAGAPPNDRTVCMTNRKQDKQNTRCDIVPSTKARAPKQPRSHTLSDSVCPVFGSGVSASLLDRNLDPWLSPIPRWPTRSTRTSSRTGRGNRRQSINIDDYIMYTTGAYWSTIEGVQGVRERLL
jgi:hypothetical protein